MKNFILILIATFFLQSFPLLAEDAFTPFARGNIQYQEGKYAEALESYQQALSGSNSANLHYNLGNTYSQLGDAGNAVLHFEKALALDPGMHDAALNISWLRDKAGLTEWETTVWQKLTTILSYNGWVWLTVIAFWATLALWILPRIIGRSSLFSRLFAFLAATATLLGGAALLWMNKDLSRGVILTADTQLRVAPTPESPELTQLAPGRYAWSEGKQGQFIRIRLADGTAGYVHSTEWAPVYQ